MGNNKHTPDELSLFESHISGTTILPKFSIYHNGITNIYPNDEWDLKTLAESIRTDTILRQNTEQLRSIGDEKERAEFKKSFVYVTFSGTFRKRTNEELLCPSGYICMDLDHIGDAVRLRVIQGQIIKSLTPAMMFISPSGDGLKIIFQIDLSQGTHAEYFSSLAYYFKTKIKFDVDPTGKDVARACFICHDPKAYFSDAPIILDRIFIDAFNISKTPIQGNPGEEVPDPNEIYKRCKTWLNKKEQFTDGNRNHYITRLAGILNRCGVPEHFTLKELANFAETGFTKQEIESTVKSIYRNTSFHGIAKLNEDSPSKSTNLPHAEPVEGKTSPPTPLLPIEGLPEFLQNLIIECSDTYGTHRDFWAGAIISATCLALGKNIKIKNKYTNGAVLWIALIAPTGSGKTEPLKFAFSPFHRMDAKSFADFDKAMDEYDSIKGMSKRDRASLGITEIPELPVCKQYIISDSTPESLYQVHKNNSRGVIMLRDELKGWIDDFGRYNKAGEVANWISSWSEQAMTFNRKSERPMKIGEPFICAAGGLQPAIIPELARDNRAANGFMVRLCNVYPDKADRPYYKDKELPTSLHDKYEAYLKNLLSINNPETEYISLTSEAQKLYQEFDNRNTDLINSQENEYLRGMLAKLPVIALRLALVIHYSNWACDGVDHPKINPGTIQAAIKMTEYFKITGEKVFRQLEKNSIQGLNHKNVAEYLNIEKGYNQSEIARILKLTHQYVNKIFKKT
jgi:Protein of unknown function (DUF3987)/BT4734-like, N-terminal domain/Primase C terminal 1 (PriCT-1)